MNIDITKPYQTCDGRKVRILCTDAPGDFQNGSFLYATKEEADKSAGSQRTFCAKVEWDS